MAWWATGSHSTNCFDKLCFLLLKIKKNNYRSLEETPFFSEKNIYSLSCLLNRIRTLTIEKVEEVHALLEDEMPFQKQKPIITEGISVMLIHNGLLRTAEAIANCIQKRNVKVQVRESLTTDVYQQKLQSEKLFFFLFVNHPNITTKNKAILFLIIKL